MVSCRRRIERFVAFDAPILIDGETGTGKDLAARAIHNRSARCDAPYVPVNCGALPETLVENELFGHKAGAFTDARGEQVGLVSQAGNGTLFLDEIETLSQRAQAALLRFLESHEYRPLGASTVRHCDARIIAATNVDLKTLVDKGEFRADLFYRLNILTLSMPTLRARREDIPLLANYFVRRLAGRYDRPVITLTAETVRWITRHDWPGNVRELENLIHREFLMCFDY
jgi:DNA-binding NtrC family response regulator